MTKMLIDRAVVEQALEALEEAVKFWHEEFEYRSCVDAADPWEEAATALKAALAEPVQEPDLSRCPKCNGPADNGHDREVPPNPYYCTKCMAEPVQEPWEHLKQYGYAPGSYMSKCHACDKIASGVDKRAITCRPCAEARHAALAQPAQEPVAWMTVRLNVPIQTTARKDVADEWLKWGEVLPLYTAPPQPPAQPAQPVQEPVAKCVDDICSEHLGRVEAFDHLPRGTLLYAILPQRKPLKKEQLLYIYNQLPNWGMDMDSLPQGLEKFARAVERAHGIGVQP